MAQIESSKAIRVEKTRSQFKTLLASNPNYFGNAFGDLLPKPIKKITSNTSYEELSAIGYNPKRRELQATFDVKKSGGYGGDVCDDGTLEYVRFYVETSTGWDDAGIAAARVHDVPAAKDCAGKQELPLSYSVTVDYASFTNFCFISRLPRARAILSWNNPPPAGQPDWKPVYGSVMECNIQLDKRFIFSQWLTELVDVVEVPTKLIDALLPISAALESPIDGDAVSLPALSTADLVDLYSTPTRGKKVKLTEDPKRVAFTEVQALQLSPAPATYLKLAASLDVAGINLADLVLQIEDTTGNISYEELEEVGLDPNLDRLVASFRVKKQSGFSGNFCTAGSTEYVAFWEDWNDSCNWRYLGTAEVKAYDFDDLPDDGLCYTASLPVNADEIARLCEGTEPSRVRAVLSWNTPPSTTDPNALPTWGNRVDSHVLVPPRSPIAGPQFSTLGGVGVEHISDVTGLTTPGTVMALSGVLADHLDRACPFGGRLTATGSSLGLDYRVLVRELGSVAYTPLVKSIYVTDLGGTTTLYAPFTADGWFHALPWTQNTLGILGYFDSSGDDQYEVVLEVAGLGNTDSQIVQLDNTWPDVSVTITQPGGDCGIFDPNVQLQGKAFATDAFMDSWGVDIDGGPSGFGPEGTTTASSTTQNTPLGGATWDYDGSLANGGAGLQQCGYIVNVWARDRAIVGNYNGGHYSSDDVGFCIIE